MAKNKLLIISLDAVSNDDVAILAECPTFRKLSEGGTLVSNVHSIYLSNTYPIHTSILTGCHPLKHGIYDNTLPMPGDARPGWNWYAKAIKVPTLYQKAAEQNLITASLLWPVTAKASIRFNIPEILPKKPWENQIILSLLNGSPLLQLSSVLKFGKHLHGSAQPQLDDFSCAVLCDLIRRKQPDLMLIHLTDADSHKHAYGAGSPEAIAAIRRMDGRLHDLLAALSASGMEKDCHIILLSDHGMTDVARSINPNTYLAEKGLIKYNPNGTVAFWKAWIKCSGGSGFLYLNNAEDHESLALATKIIGQQSEISGSGIKGVLNEEEFILSGLSQECAFGISPTDGVEFVEHARNAHRANHGYSLKSNKYNTFYLLHGPRIQKNRRLEGGSLLDIAPLSAELLKIPAWNMDGQLRTDLLYDKED